MKESLSYLKLKFSNLLEDATLALPWLHWSLHFLKNHSNLFYQRDIYRDYSETKNRYRFLTETSYRKNKKVLIVSLTHFLYQIKLEAMLAKALQLRGCEINVLTWRHCLWPQRYFRLFGIDRFVFFEDYLRKVNNININDVIKSVVKGGLSFQEVKKWKFRGCRIGQQVLSTLARKMYGTPDITSSEVYPIFIQWVKKEIKAIYACEILLDQLNPDILIFNEANGSIYGAIFDQAFNRGKDVIQFVQPFRDDALIFKRFDKESKGLHPNSVSKSTFEKIIKPMGWSENCERLLKDEFLARYGNRWFLSQRNQLGKTTKPKEEIINQLGLDKKKKIAVIFSHILWDANLFYGEDLFQDYEEWFIETVKTACRNPRVNWIVKLHPANIWKLPREGVKNSLLREEKLIKEKIGKLPSHIYLLYPTTDINTFSLFNLADYGITVRGTVGMELPCFGKPTLTAGTGRYSGFGFTIDHTTKEEYLENLHNIEKIPPLSSYQTLLAKKHAYAVFCLRPWEMKSFRAKFRYKLEKAHPLDHNLIPAVSSIDELKNSSDLAKFSEWVLYSDLCDYIEKDKLCAV